ncbi:MAG: hypothetical protein KGY67_00870 [Candidatus Thermoplasmatota archaeon]|nr:hypothetical protein [Candidatus Thermoplasmatota archaeon]
MVILSIAIAFLFISTVTFLPLAQSKPIMNKINVLEEKNELWSGTDQKSGLIQNIINEIQVLFQLIQQLIE